MASRRLLAGLGAGGILGFGLIVLLVCGSVVFAVSGEQTVRVPLLVTARSGAGPHLLTMQVHSAGMLAWLVGLTLLIGIPLALLRRGRQDG
jgi:hypothetical protein